MKKVMKLALVLGLGLPLGTALAASEVETYLKTFTKGPGVPEPVKVVAPAKVNAPHGAEVVLAFVVDRDGVPQSIAVAEGRHSALAQAAVAAVKEWRFSPVVRDGVPVETKVLLPVRVNRDSLAGPGYAAR